jgi:hypothetical protein
VLLAHPAVGPFGRGWLNLGRFGRGAGEHGADGAVRDGRGGGDLAMRQFEPRGALDRLVVVGVGFTFAFGGALNPAEHVGAPARRARSSPTCSALAVLLGGARILATVGAEAVGGGLSDGVQFG